ncbi:MAG: phosphonate ABC transporter, permease protein PhnE [Spirochaetales bacterium]|nr:phosphonate ABC transporter, permease protein PhnE [Spirochaetales bacterium]
MNSLLTNSEGAGTYLKSKRIRLFLFFVGLFAAAALSMAATNYHIEDSFTAIPKVIVWMARNLVPDGKSLTRLPKILDKLFETVLMSVAASVSAAALSFPVALAGSATSCKQRWLMYSARGVASFFRNIPIVAWAMIFLLTFGQSPFTGYVALFFASFGFLARAFIEAIDETAAAPVEALRAAGGSYGHIIFQGVLPSVLPQMVSWVLYMIETNIRSAALVGLLTGSGIGFTFSIYYKSLQYQSASLVVITIVAVVLVIEAVSNKLRRLIL